MGLTLGILDRMPQANLCVLNIVNLDIKMNTQSFKTFQALLSLGASPNYKDRCGLTPLYHTVLAGGDTSCCETLLYYRAKLGTRDENGWDESHQVPADSLTSAHQLALKKHTRPSVWWFPFISRCFRSLSLFTWTGAMRHHFPRLIPVLCVMCHCSLTAFSHPQPLSSVPSSRVSPFSLLPRLFSLSIAQGQRGVWNGRNA